MSDPFKFHRRSDDLEDLVRRKLEEAEKLIDEAIELVMIMRRYDLQASYSLAPKEIDPYRFAKQERKEKEAKRRRRRKR